jgi:hypothetical protein
MLTSKASRGPNLLLWLLISGFMRQHRDDGVLHPPRSGMRDAGEVLHCIIMVWGYINPRDGHRIFSAVPREVPLVLI